MTACSRGPRGSTGSRRRPGSVVRNLVLKPPPGLADFTIYFACLALFLLRDWLFPAADIRVAPSCPQIAAPGGWPPDRDADAPTIQLVNDRG